jgi:hypothetical protein
MVTIGAERSCLDLTQSCLPPGSVTAALMASIRIRSVSKSRTLGEEELMVEGRA